jgi:hypothetical protein
MGQVDEQDLDFKTRLIFFFSWNKNLIFLCKIHFNILNVETRIEPRDPLKTKEPTNRGTNQPTMGQSEPTTRMDGRMDG